MKHFKLFLLFLLFASSGIAQVAPVAYYPFNGNANDESGNGYHGTVHGATLTTDRFGNANSAYAFSGVGRADSIDCGYVRELNNQQEITVACWINQTNLDLARGIWNYRATNNNQVNIDFIQLRTYHDGNMWGYQRGALLPYDYSQSVTANQWHHVAYSYSEVNDSLKLYIDGQRVAYIIDTSIRIFFGDSMFTRLTLGMDAPNYYAGGCWNGKLDDFYFFNRELTASQVDSLYNLPDPAACTVTIPDANLKASLIAPAQGIDTNADGEIQCDEAAAVTGTLYPQQNEPGPVADFTGIEAFVNVTRIDFSGTTTASTIDLSGNINLTDVSCVNCSTVTSVTLNNPDLSWADFRFSGLTSIDITSVDTLRVLKLKETPLTSIIGEDHLYGWLGIAGCPISNTDLSGAVGLKNLDARKSGLTSLDLSGAPGMDYVWVDTCQNLSYCNIANGNNVNFLLFYAKETPNLTCIQVDDPALFTPGLNADAGDVFSTNCITGLEENVLDDLEIFPVPVSEYLEVRTSHPLSAMEVVNLQGQVLLKTDGNSDRLDVSQLAPGIYLLLLSSEEGHAVRKFSKY